MGFVCNLAITISMQMELNASTNVVMIKLPFRFPQTLYNVKRLYNVQMSVCQLHMVDSRFVYHVLAWAW